MDVDTFSKILKDPSKEAVAIYFFMFRKGTADDALENISRVNPGVHKEDVQEALDYFVKIRMIKKIGNKYSIEPGFEKDIELDLELRKEKNAKEKD